MPQCKIEAERDDLKSTVEAIETKLKEAGYPVMDDDNVEDIVYKICEDKTELDCDVDKQEKELKQLEGRHEVILPNGRTFTIIPEAQQLTILTKGMPPEVSVGIDAMWVK